MLVLLIKCACIGNSSENECNMLILIIILDLQCKYEMVHNSQVISAESPLKEKAMVFKILIYIEWVFDWKEKSDLRDTFGLDIVELFIVSLYQNSC